MKIVKIEVLSVKVPTKKTYEVSFGTITSSEAVLVKIYTDENIIGIGESDPLPKFSRETQATVETVIEEYLAPAVIGLDPFDMENIHAKMNTTIDGNPFAKAAIDLALHDVMGKALSIPVYRLLGGLNQRKIPVIWPLGHDKPERNAKDALKRVKQGFKTLMIKVGAENPDKDLERVKKVREVVGEDVNLILDANQGWHPKEAIGIIKEIERYNLTFVEQPVSSWDFNGMADVRKSVQTPISADESLFSLHDAIKLIENKSADIFSIKTGKHGGIHNAKKIAALAEAKGIPCFINSMIELGVSVAASLHFAVSTSQILTCGHSLMSPLRLEGDILETPIQIKDGFIEVQDKPGLGVELSQEKVKKYQIGG